MNNGKEDEKRLADFLFEIGTARKLARMHRQTLLTDDMSDNIATHSFRVTMIGWILAKMEGADPYKVLLMSLIHDIGEIRTNDHNWIHKRYVKILEEEVNKEQLGDLPFRDLKEMADEYRERISKESIVAKDADLLDQVLLLREYEWQGNREAAKWLRGKGGEDEGNYNKQLSMLKTKSAVKLGEAVLSEDPSDWWTNLWTNRNM